MKTLGIFNIASHYRAPIFIQMDRELGCDFVVGDRVGGKFSDIKKMDYGLLTHQVTEVHNVNRKHYYYQQGVQKYLRKPYDTYIMLGETRCLSTWLFLIRSLFYPKKKIYLWSHGELGKTGKGGRFLKRLLYGFCDGAFIYNERSVKLMAEMGIPFQKLHIIYNSLNYDAQLPIRNSLQPLRLYQSHFGNDNKNIVFIGRLVTAKRFDLLLDAVLILKKRGVFVNVTFIGDGVERQNMERMAEDYGIKEQVWFYGACYDERINAELLYNSDLCVSPGHIGLTAMHTMMFGCPAITHDNYDRQTPEFEAIREGETGSFFHENDSTSLADCISRWLVEHADVDSRNRVRQACYAEIDTKWNPHNQIRIFKEVLFGEDKQQEQVSLLGS